MIGLDTNILARYFIEDESDSAAVQQRIAAQRLIESGKPLMISKTVMLEFEWVMRGYYELEPPAIFSVFEYLLNCNHILLEDRTAIEQAIANFKLGLDFADALHHATYRDCDAMASFDDRKFSKRAARLGLAPRVIVPK